MPGWRNWQTRTTQNRVEKSVEVRFLSRAHRYKKEGFCLLFYIRIASLKQIAVSIVIFITTYNGIYYHDLGHCTTTS